MVDIKNSFISHLLDVETWPMTNGRNDLPFAMKSYTSWLMVDLDLPFSIWWFSNLAYGRCIFHVPVYHLPVEVRVYHLPMMKNMISTMCHLPSVYAPWAHIVVWLNNLPGRKESGCQPCRGCSGCGWMHRRGCHPRRVNPLLRDMFITCKAKSYFQRNDAQCTYF